MYMLKFKYMNNNNILTTESQFNSDIYIFKVKMRIQQKS